MAATQFQQRTGHRLHLLVTTQCINSNTNSGGFYAISLNALLNGSLGNPTLQSIPNTYAPVTDSEVADTSTEYLYQPMVDAQQNVSVNLAPLASDGTFQPGAVVNYPLGIQGSVTVPFANQAADNHGNPACSGCIASKNSITAQDEAFKMSNTSWPFPNYYDTIYLSLSIGVPASAPTNGALIIAAIQPNAPAGQQSYSMLYQPSTSAETFTYGSVASACIESNSCGAYCFCGCHQFLLGYDDLSSSILPSEAYVLGNLSPSGLTLTSMPATFKVSNAQAGADNTASPPGNQCVVGGATNANPYCRWGDYSFTFWSPIGNTWWTDTNYSYFQSLGSGSYFDTWADWVAGVTVPKPPECQ